MIHKTLLFHRRALRLNLPFGHSEPLPSLATLCFILPQQVAGVSRCTLGELAEWEWGRSKIDILAQELAPELAWLIAASKNAGSV
jgi:hypothetical protein